MRILGIIAVCVLGIFARRAFADASVGGPKIGDVPPPLRLGKTLQGPPASQISWDKLKGKVVVLEFWATWCSPCVRTIPYLNRLTEQFKGKPIVFISVSDENEDLVRRFLKNHPMRTWVALDNYDVLNKAFHVATIPHAVIVDATGRIAAIANPANIKARNLEEVLAGKKCSLPPPTVYTISRFTDQVVPNQAPPLFEISIREHEMPQRFEGPICMWSRIPDGCGFQGKIATVESALNFVFDKSAVRTEIKCPLPDGYYDFELRCPSGHAAELKEQFIAALRTTFGLKVKRTTKIMDVYVMTQISTNAPELHKAKSPGGGGEIRGGFCLDGSRMDTVAEYLEMALGKPVFNETHLKGLFDVDMKWKLSKAEQLEATLVQVLGRIFQPRNMEKATRDSEQAQPDPGDVIIAAREQLGLQLTLTRRPVEVLEVSKT